MCGIFGIVGRNDPELLKRMDEVLFHRGPDSSGSINFDDVSIGVRRLSIIDLEKGDQPIHNENKRLWVVQNGEIYNYLVLKKELAAKGHRFYTDSDTEVIVHAFEEYGEECVRHFNGMFAFVIWDEKKKRLFGARDRVGIKPFYYRHCGKILLFASEIKAILQDDSFRRELDITAFYNYLSRLFVPGDRTIFKGIRSLPAGHIIIFEKGALDIRAYWDLELRKKRFLRGNEYKEVICQKLENSVKRQLVSDVPLGAFLSGGVDSNGIVAFMAKNTDEPVHTFTMGYTGNDAGLTNELRYARTSAEFFNTDHREFIINPADTIRDLPRIVWFFDQPYAGSLAQYQLSRLAREYVKVVLCGLGGDELFGDYGRGRRIAQSFNRLSVVFLSSPAYVKTAIQEMSRLVPRAIKNTGIYSVFYRYVIRVLELGKVYADREGIFTEAVKRQLVEDRIVEQVEIKDTLSEIFAGFLAQQKAGGIEDIILYFDFKTQLPDEYLRYTDTLSMAHSLESRVPYLDNELIEYAVTIPYNHLVKDEDAKYLLRSALKNILPPGTTERGKGYFSLPYGDWLRTALRSLVLDVLSKANIERTGYLSYEKVKAIIDEQYAGDDSKTYQVWNLLMFFLWHVIFIEKAAANIVEIENMDFNSLLLPENTKAAAWTYEKA